ncbi:4-hydroxybenzoate octaprenyltransferase [Fundidesulfovibrio magnetotacticus]|uniref:4-hydroxybenzoate octaprenyltransferase n=1 Tax=Fundidesulfovibrio magnetotacticus TaxID=2730080 RepID=A0A6V8LTE9_9BACT|nr:UbiA family prenyltransferase [Fundidesulfovibrio magnetotacticus]GFK93598.1 4-hydroxybenzoate octaprenyltransferase [Fundidesulfovibrio magnetotacticus]
MPLPSAPAAGVFTRLKPFLALSRTPHGLMDMAMPVAAALACLGAFPPPGTSLLGLITVFAGYTAVYAVNDLADYRTDRANHLAGPPDTSGYLDAAFARHPLAMGLLTWRQGLAWTGIWAVAALAGAWALNPACAWLLLVGVALEVVYCGLLKVTHLRALVNGVVKSLGGAAAVLAVAPHAPLWIPVAIFVMTFCWEIGGQNIPADWFDLELDRAQGARTLCVSLGLERAARVSVWTLSASTALAGLVLWLSPMGMPWWLAALGVGTAAWLLVLPALGLAREQSRESASLLFNRSSWFPVALLATLLAGLALR